jgi:hypothetical protein
MLLCVAAYVYDFCAEHSTYYSLLSITPPATISGMLPTRLQESVLFPYMQLSKSPLLSPHHLLPETVFVRIFLDARVGLVPLHPADITTIRSMAVA